MEIEMESGIMEWLRGIRGSKRSGSLLVVLVIRIAVHWGSNWVPLFLESPIYKFLVWGLRLKKFTAQSSGLGSLKREGRTQG